MVASKEAVVAGEQKVAIRYRSRTGFRLADASASADPAPCKKDAGERTGERPPAGIAWFKPVGSSSRTVDRTNGGALSREVTRRALRAHELSNPMLSRKSPGWRANSKLSPLVIGTFLAMPDSVPRALRKNGVEIPPPA
jgi:hypothetical protein